MENKIDILTKINDEKAKNKKIDEAKADKAQQRHDAKVEALTPIFNAVVPIRKLGFSVEWNDRSNHYPYPAIHIRGGNTYNEIGEVFLNDGKILSGGCNSHNNSFDTLEEFVDFVAETIAA